MPNDKRQCSAIQMSDQMCCAKCGLAWDVNDQYPPECGRKTGIFQETFRQPSPPPLNLTPAATPDGYSIFVRYEKYIEVMIGWSSCPQSMAAIALQALGFSGAKAPPFGLEIVVYREPELDQMAHIPRPRVSFIQHECTVARALLANGCTQTTHWEDVQIRSALMARKELEKYM